MSAKPRSPASKVARAASAPSEPSPLLTRRRVLLAGAALVGGGGMGLAALLQPGARRAAFDAKRAFTDLEEQVNFGPRVPGTTGHVACREYLLRALRPLAESVEQQEFSQRVRGRRLPMVNLIARWRGLNPAARREGVLLCAHWDTRPTADYDRDPKRRGEGIAGANDGASGVAVLLEAARMFKQTMPPVPVMIAFFDGEDYGPGVDQMFFGSRHFAANLPENAPLRGILLDMVGDRDLRIPQEGYSRAHAPEIIDEVYAIARRLNLEKQFPSVPGAFVEDDHMPLIQRGIKMIDLIDFDYGPNNSWWHTHEDTPDKCSPASLKAVGDLVTEWVYTRS